MTNDESMTNVRMSEYRTRRSCFVIRTFEHSNIDSSFVIRISTFAWTVLIFLALPGCCPQIQPTPAEKLNPPNLLTLAQLASTINANNQRIPSLWSTLNYSATIIDNGVSHSVSSDDGVLLYQRPSMFRLVGKKEFVGTVFDIGSNGTEYWLDVVPGTNTLWWGKYADLARFSTSRLPIPIRPDLVMEVLGVSTIDMNFNALPVPTLRYDNVADAYVLVFNIKAPDRWLAEKEVWYDRQTLRPRRVILYDPNGRPVLKAELSSDKQVAVEDQPQSDWPSVAGDYKLFFPDSGSRMEFSLKDVRRSKSLGRVTIPNDGSFQLPDVQGTDIKSIQIGGGGV
jgi:hypothetical protein